jgi:hypothetical protein
VVTVLGERRQTVILLRLFFFSWCRDTVVVLEEQTMASLVKTVVSLPLRFPSSLSLLSLLFFLLLCFVSVSPLLLLVAVVVGGAAGDKAK